MQSNIATKFINHILIFFFFFNDTATTEIYTLSLHDALPICDGFQELARSLGYKNANDAEMCGCVYVGYTSFFCEIKPTEAQRATIIYMAKQRRCSVPEWLDKSMRVTAYHLLDIICPSDYRFIGSAWINQSGRMLFVSSSGHYDSARMMGFSADNDNYDVVTKMENAGYCHLSGGEIVSIPSRISEHMRDTVNEWCKATGNTVPRAFRYDLDDSYTSSSKPLFIGMPRRIYEM